MYIYNLKFVALTNLLKQIQYPIAHANYLEAYVQKPSYVMRAPEPTVSVILTVRME